jgi:hypothetical protein
VFSEAETEYLNIRYIKLRNEISLPSSGFKTAEQDTRVKVGGGKSVEFQRATRCYCSQDGAIKEYRCENLQLYNLRLSLTVRCPKFRTHTRKTKKNKIYITRHAVAQVARRWLPAITCRAEIRIT